LEGVTLGVNADLVKQIYVSVNNHELRAFFLESWSEDRAGLRPKA